MRMFPNSESKEPPSNNQTADELRRAIKENKGKLVKLEKEAEPYLKFLSDYLGPEANNIADTVEQVSQIAKDYVTRIKTLTTQILEQEKTLNDLSQPPKSENFRY